MQSRIAEELSMKTNPVALVWSDYAPEGAVQFKPGTWGCVISMLAMVAAKGKTAAFDRDTYGCWGGGVGLGFGNAYKTFPGGVECFCGFLSSGNKDTEQGRQIGAHLGRSGGDFADDFLEGERYLKSPEVTSRFLDALPMREIPTRYVVAKPLKDIDPTRDKVNNVTFFIEPDELSALVNLANHSQPEKENVALPWGAGCQVIGILAYREGEREHPRALVGMTDLSARKNVRALLGKHVMSFTAPWPVFERMEHDIDTAFFHRTTWRVLRTNS